MVISNSLENIVKSNSIDVNNGYLSDNSSLSRSRSRNNNTKPSELGDLKN